MPHRSVPLVGLVGGVGSGKSAVADAVAVAMRGVVIRADETGHRALKQPSIQRRLKETFGKQVVDSNGEVDRKFLANLVFGSSPEATGNREKLNAIVHPWIRSQHLREIEHLETTGEYDVILLDAPVLLEAGWQDVCDVIAFIEVPREVRLQRVAGRGWDENELTRREASQLPLDEKRTRSHVVVDNSGTVEAAAQALSHYIQSFISPSPLNQPVEVGTSAI
ncbi:MAG: dephospho-CoA kinase [Planctomycetaceae bacterium]|nr:dephospho-CoA kinase [Planctomycetaceae bacterium]